MRMGRIFSRVGIAVIEHLHLGCYACAMLGIGAKIPMSTTWVFLGMLAGREVALRLRLQEANTDGRKVWPMVFSDLGKATIGLVVSVLLVVFLYLVEGRDLALLFG